MRIILIILSVLFCLIESVKFSHAETIDPNITVRQNMTADIDGNLEVHDYNERIKNVQLAGPTGLITHLEAREMSKAAPIHVSRGDTLYLNGMTKEEFDKDKKAQIVALELRKANLFYDKADLLQQYNWHDHLLNEQIWKMDLAIAELDNTHISDRTKKNYQARRKYEKKITS